MDLLVKRLRVLLILSFVGTCVVGCFKVFFEKSLQPASFRTEEAFQVSKVSMGALAVLMLTEILGFVGLHTGTGHRLGHVRPAVFEAVVASVMTWGMVLSVLRHPAHVAQLLGYTVADTFPDRYLSDSTTLMLIDGMITFVHIGCPMRWCSMIPLQVAGIVLYLVIVFVLGSFETTVDNVYSIFFVSFIVVIASLGKRAAEVSQRQNFLDILEQKRLRCRAEFALSRVECEQVAEDARQELRSESQRNSTHATTLSQRVFDVHDDEVTHSAEQLDTIKRLGNSEHWCIQEKEVKLLHDDILGTGSYGQVTKGIFCGMVVAVKAPHDKLKASHLRRLPALCNELRILRRVRHVNIVTFHGATINPANRRIALVMELVHGQVLKQVVLQEGEELLSAFSRYQLILGVCNALLYLHTRQPGIVHGDLKATNVLVEKANDNLIPKLLDFGLSRALSNRPRRLGGTLAWMAPEVFRSDSPVKCSADIYSFGRLTSFIATSIEPMSGMTARKIKNALSQGRPPLPVWPSRCTLEPKIKTLVHACLRAGEMERPLICHVHARLLNLPQELNLLETHGHLLEDVQLVVQHSNQQGTAHPASSDVSSEVSFFSEPGNEDFAPRHRLPPLAEDEMEEPECPPQEPPAEGARRASPPRGSASPGSKRLCRLHPYPNQPETSHEAMLATLDAAARRWNINSPQASCCEMHTRINVLLRLCQLELGRACRSDAAAQQQAVAQCPECGILGIATVCDTCGWAPEEASEEDVTTRVEL